MKSNTKMSVYILSLLILICLTCNIKLNAQEIDPAFFKKEFDFSLDRTNKIGFYKMETNVVKYSPDGKKIGTDIYTLFLKCVPKNVSGEIIEEYTCKKFIVSLNNTPEVSIPSLNGWIHVFGRNINKVDKKNLVLGIDHDKFEKLIDEKGKPLPVESNYMVYNSFIDFHAFCNEFSQKTDQGNGIQDLKQIGQKIIHGAAFSEPTVDLGSNIKKGSYFKNGKITLEFKGLTVVKDEMCAIITFDSGESSFKMIFDAMPGVETTATGSSHYIGDIYIDLKTHWVQKVTMDEFVISEVKLPSFPNKVNNAVERLLTIEVINESEYEKQ